MLRSGTTMAKTRAREGDDGLPIFAFRSAAAFGRWLAKHHDTSDGLWLEVRKKGGGRSGPTYAEALEEALRFGWIDGRKEKLDADCFLQRFTARRPRSKWSKRNRAAAERLIAAGRMESPGLAAVEAARADGRWAAAYDSGRTASIPTDLKEALHRDARARAFFDTLDSRNRYAILYRIQNAKRPETRARLVAKFVQMCARGETIH